MGSGFAIYLHILFLQGMQFIRRADLYRKAHSLAHIGLHESSASSKLGQETVFITVGSALSGGIIFVNKRGAVMSAKAHNLNSLPCRSLGLHF